MPPSRIAVDASSQVAAQPNRRRAVAPRRAPRRSRLAVASTVATAPGSRRADASRQSTNDFERHGDEADRQHDDEVPERTGRTSHPEMVDP